MNGTSAWPVTASHLQRNAYLYVRQSTVRQVVENVESTQRQYALRQRAVALGWQVDQIVVIDSDLGQSAAATVDRRGFQQLVTEVGMGRAGIVLGLEVSRLARNSTDWHRLLEICALTDTLILDEDGIYDPAHFNDRLLLGLKGTMSEAELHVLRARLRGGILNKARRGELRCQLPIGLVHDPAGRVVLDPDGQVRRSVELLFETFARTGTACATVKHFNHEGLLFPLRVHRGPRKGELVWQRLGLWRALSILHNPRLAGAYAYGRRRSRRMPDGRTKTALLPRSQWQVLLPDSHPGYISWAEHLRIQQRLHESALAYGADRRHGPPREGPALLQGLAVCGKCGTRMSVRYHRRGELLVPDYMCHVRTMEHRDPPCQKIPGATIDVAIGELLVEVMTPMALELSLAVQEEIRQRAEQTDRLRQHQVQRARHEADLARSRYLQVDPTNRLVADALEADWNDKLRAHNAAQQDYEQERAKDRARLDEVQRERILALADDFPALWNDPATSHRDRKRMATLLIEDVTIVKQEVITLHVRFRGGKIRTLTLPVPLNAWQGRQTTPDVVALIDVLLEENTDAQIAAILNQRGMISGAGQPFTGNSVGWVRRSAGLSSLRERLRARGMLTTEEVASRLGIRPTAVKDRRRRGLLDARIVDDKGGCLFAPLAVEQMAAGVHRRDPQTPPSVDSRA